MPHHPTHPADALTPLRYGDAILHPPTLPAPRLPLAEIPAGVQYVTLPDGTRTLAYTSAPEPQPAQTIPAWAKTTALLAPTVGGGIAAAGYGIAYAAPGLSALTEALWATVALIAAGALVAIARPRRSTNRPTTHITQNITATGWFSRATGSVNHR
ncbi:hypothetical protein [Streptomyces goshikiensis]|uniref:hypothetical protein n=1 Tax=Streptomyces goshikiensis TaxID=1942 RepID=UPI0022F383D2|nr:hypothetical protein [Streptomyces goshikiensis]WBY20035.1 hypothetical protein PET44_10575 [Streptomyces goshikiensis]